LLAQMMRHRQKGVWYVELFYLEQVHAISLLQFISDTSIVFAAFRNLMIATRDKNSEWYCVSLILCIFN